MVERHPSPLCEAPFGHCRCLYWQDLGIVGGLKSQLRRAAWEPLLWSCCVEDNGTKEGPLGDRAGEACSVAPTVTDPPRGHPCLGAPLYAAALEPRGMGRGCPQTGDTPLPTAGKRAGLERPSGLEGSFRPQPGCPPAIAWLSTGHSLAVQLVSYVLRCLDA